MGGSGSNEMKRACHFYSESNPGETPIFRSTEYPLYAPLPEKLNGTISTVLEAFE